MNTVTDYCTQADLDARFGADEILQLTDRDADGVADTGVLDVAIADAGTTIDTYIAKRYDLPLAEIPAALVKVACDMVRYALHKEDPPDRVAASQKDAMTFLRDVAAGRAVLDVAGTEPVGAVDDVIVEGPDRVFSSDTMTGF
ncbi:MAG: DUF1320 domain-containing protein [Rhodospirillales bacterium CG15_BIG_FIL_POST_REV_8_21_14_020_66_15]|nr:MAG: DUF1320 domain-containing protein [Rhodospirillales bacterium CG15_BIG_FIL_POST_REV_8_21_14_020_66_15]